MNRYLVTYAVHEPFRDALDHASGIVGTYPWRWLAVARARHFNRWCGVYAAARVTELLP